MNISDPIADMLTRVRNASRARHTEVVVPGVADQARDRPHPQGRGLHRRRQRGAGRPDGQSCASPSSTSTARCPVVSGLKRISKPGLRVYARKTDIPRVLGGLGIVIVSTSQGIMTGQQARQAQLGGEVLAFVW